MKNIDSESKTVAHIGTRSPDIQFRDASPITGGDVAGIALVTLLLLGSFAALAVMAKRKGWIEKYFRKATLMGPGFDGFRLTGSLRLSKHTILYKVTDGQSGFLLVESSLNTSMQAAGNSKAEDSCQ